MADSRFDAPADASPPDKRNTSGVRSVTDDDLPALGALIAAQQARHHALDRYLRAPRSQPFISETLLQHRAAPIAPLLIVMGGRVRAYAAPGVLEQAMESAVFAPRTGRARWLTLPPPDAPDCEAVTTAAFDHLDEVWAARRCDGAYVSWPACDVGWIEPCIFAHGFQLDTVIAARPHGPLTVCAGALPTDVRIRAARRDDEDALARLTIEEMAFHEAHTPFSRVTSSLGRQFRHKFEQSFDSMRAPDAPFYLVAEQLSSILGMAELKVDDVTRRDSVLHAAVYGCVYNFVVRADARGRGIGMALTQAGLRMLEERGAQAHYLYYAPANPLSSRFWPKLGFPPVLLNYQRRM